MAHKTHNRKDCIVHDGLLFASVKNKFKSTYSELPWWLIGKECVCNAGVVGSITEPGRSPGEGYGNPLEYSCLENPMGRGAWWATVHGVAGLDMIVHSCTHKVYLLSINHKAKTVSSVQFSHSVVSDSLWPHGLHPVHHQLPELTQIHVHWVGDAIQPSYPLSSPSPPAFNLSQHQGLFQWISSSHRVAKVLELQLQHQSFQWIFRTDLL